MKRAALVLLLALGAPTLARAVSDPSEMLADPRQEARAEAIGRELRCLVCQNEDIEDSGADLARDLRHVVRTEVAAGRSDREIMRWMVARYGNFVRLAPPFTSGTALLWLMPALALLAGLAAALRVLRAPQRAASPLDADEQRRLDELLSKEGQGAALDPPRGSRPLDPTT